MDNINSLCRVCGELTESKKSKKHYQKPYLIKNVSKELVTIFGIGFTLEEGDFISKYVCLKCKMNIQYCASSLNLHTKDRITRELQASSQLWVSFDSSMSTEDCNTCTHICRLRQGSRYKKKEDKENFQK